MDTLIDDTQKVELSITKTDQHGNPVAFVDVPAWSSADTSVATVTAADDGLSATVFAVASGSTNIQISADTLTKLWNVVVAGPEILVSSRAPQPK